MAASPIFVYNTPFDPLLFFIPQYSYLVYLYYSTITVYRFVLGDDSIHATILRYCSLVALHPVSHLELKEIYPTRWASVQVINKLRSLHGCLLLFRRPLWCGVKEQAASLYAKKLAQEGFTTAYFDASRQGESGGEPCFLEDPSQRVSDFVD